MSCTVLLTHHDTVMAGGPFPFDIHAWAWIDAADGGGATCTDTTFAVIELRPPGPPAAPEFEYLAHEALDEPDLARGLTVTVAAALAAHRHSIDPDVEPIVFYGLRSYQCSRCSATVVVPNPEVRRKVGREYWGSAVSEMCPIDMQAGRRNADAAYEALRVFTRDEVRDALFTAVLRAIRDWRDRSAEVSVEARLTGVIGVAVHPVRRRQGSAPVLAAARPASRPTTRSSTGHASSTGRRVRRAVPT